MGLLFSHDAVQHDTVQHNTVSLDTVSLDTVSSGAVKCDIVSLDDLLKRFPNHEPITFKKKPTVFKIKKIGDVKMIDGLSGDTLRNLLMRSISNYHFETSFDQFVIDTKKTEDVFYCRSTCFNDINLEYVTTRKDEPGDNSIYQYVRLKDSKNNIIYIN